MSESWSGSGPGTEEARSMRRAGSIFGSAPRTHRFAEWQRLPRWSSVSSPSGSWPDSQGNSKAMTPRQGQRPQPDPRG